MAISCYPQFPSGLHAENSFLGKCVRCYYRHDLMVPVLEWLIETIGSIFFEIQNLTVE
jgi:hypothetical protein